MIDTRDTRMREALHIPLYVCKTATGQCTFKYRMTNIWKSLDEVTKEIKSLNTFKATAKNGFTVLINY